MTNIKTDRVNAVLFNLHQIKRLKFFFGTPGSYFSILASLEPCLYARSIVRMALRRLTEKKIPLVMNLTEK